MDYIDFPGLGIKLEMDNIAVKIFGFPIYWYGVIIASGIFIAVFLGLRNCKKFDIVQDDLIDIILYATPIAIISARIFYVIFNISEFNSIIDMINIRRGGLAIYGGIIGIFIASIILSKKKKIKLNNLLDLSAPYIAMAQGIGRWGNFFNQEAFGSNTSLPWGMTGNKIRDELEILSKSGVKVDINKPVHPTFLYESIWNMAIFIVLILFRKKNKISGRTFYLYMILYGFGRFFIEGLRMDSLMLGPMRISQVLGALFFIIFIVIFIKSKNNKNNKESITNAATYYDMIGNESGQLDSEVSKEGNLEKLSEK